MQGSLGSSLCILLFHCPRRRSASHESTNEDFRRCSLDDKPVFIEETQVFKTVKFLACLASRSMGGKSKSAREGEGTACKDTIVFFVFFVHQTNVKILIGQI